MGVPQLLRLSLALLVAAMVTNFQHSTAQESESPAKTEAKPQVSVPPGVTDVTDLINAGKLPEATELLDQAIAANPDQESLQRLRQLLAIRYASKRDYETAVEQISQLFDYRAEHAQTPKQAAELASYALQLAAYGGRAGKAELADQAIDRALQVCESFSADHTESILLPVSQLLTRKVFTLSSQGKSDEADALAEQHLQRLSDFNASDEANDQSIQVQSRMLFSMSNSTDAKRKDKYTKQLTDFLDWALEQNPESSAVQTEYANAQYSLIASGYRDDPQGAQARIDALMKKLEPIAEQNRMVKSILARTKSIEARIESELKILEMIGKPAPPLEADAWVNAGDTTQDSLKGKVVLYDFWAIWCGPCIATFPHLREWRAEFADQGFEVVGITRYYNYKWDEEQEKAVRSQEEVEPVAEQLAIEKFLQSHDLAHPSIISPKESKMQTAYGVTGIPHAVLIDRDGNVQMVKVGSSAQNAEALHAKIKELVAQ